MSTEPRDAIYGLLHLIPQDDNDEYGKLIPDYRKPVRDVYIEWAVRAVQECCNLDLLAYAGTGKSSAQSIRGGWLPSKQKTLDLDLPSWVPDLYNRKGHGDVDWVRSERRDPAGNPRPFAINLTTNGSLVTKARCRGRVSWTTQLTVSKLGYEQDLARFCVAYLRYQRNYKPYPTGGLPPLQALSRFVMRPFLLTLTPAESDPVHGHKVHTIVLRFVSWTLRQLAVILIHELLRGVENRNLQAQSGFLSQFQSTVTEARNFESVPEIAATILGLIPDSDFQISYSTALFPGVDIQTLMGWKDWSDALDAFEDGLLDEHIWNWCLEARLLVTEQGYLGRGPTNAEAGDFVYQVEHCHKPLLFREVGTTPEPGHPRQVELLGACDVLGIGDEFDAD